MKTVITILVVVFTGFIACDTPEGTTGSSTDTTSIRSNADTSMMNTDTTTARPDSTNRR